MDTIDLHTWSEWTIDDRKAWLHAQSQQNLMQLLTIIEEMIIDCPDTEKALNTLAPSNTVIDIWRKICDTLQDIKQSLEKALLIEKTV